MQNLEIFVWEAGLVNEITSFIAETLRQLQFLATICAKDRVMQD